MNSELMVVLLSSYCTTCRCLWRPAAPHMGVSSVSQFPRQHSSGQFPAQQPSTRSLPPECRAWRNTGGFGWCFTHKRLCLSAGVTDLRTAPVRRLTFSVIRPRICSRSCRMLRGMMNRNGGHRRSPLRKTLRQKEQVWTFLNMIQSERSALQVTYSKHACLCLLHSL